MLALLGALARIALVGGAVEVRGLEARDLAREDLKVLLRITVHDAHRPDDDRPPVLGSYEIAGDVLRFRPMFPFAPGTSYRVVVAPSDADAVVEVLTAKGRSDAPTTTVVALYPTADVLPENQLKLYLHFSAPMRGGDGLRFVRLLDASGSEVIDPFLPLGTHFWDRARRRYTIFFDPGRVKRGIAPNEELGRPLEAGKRYRLVVDRSWPDENGLPLAAAFEKGFTAGPPDEEPLDPGTWKISPPRPGTRDPILADFGESLDRELLLRAIAVKDPSSRVVQGEVVLSRDETLWSFTPELPWNPGPHALVVSGILEDLAGNRIGRAFEVDVIEPVDSPKENECYRIIFNIAGADSLVTGSRRG